MKERQNLRGWRRAYVSLVACVLVCLASACSNCGVAGGPQASGGGGDVGTTTGQDGSEIRANAELLRVRGEVWLAVNAEAEPRRDGTSAGERTTTDDGAPGGDPDPGGGSTEGGAAPTERSSDVDNLNPNSGLDTSRFLPAAGLPAEVVVPVQVKTATAKSCRLRLIQSGVILAASRKECDAQGRYDWIADLRGAQLDTESPVALEIEVGSHLRALLLLELRAVDPVQADTTGEEAGSGPPAATWEILGPTVVLGHAASILGQVTDARGRPIANTEVQAMPVPDLGEPEPWRTTTDVHGQFLLDTLPPGPVSVRSVAEGHALTVVEAVAPEKDLVLKMTGLIDLEGQAYGKPEDLAAATVRVEGSGLWPALEQPLASDGSFKVEALPDGIYGLEVVVARVSGRELASLPLEGVTPDLKIDLALLPAFRVPIDVRDEAGDPIIGARVTGGYASIGLLSRSAVTDSQGHAQLGPFVPGSYVVRAQADGYLAGTPADIEVVPRGENDRNGADPVVMVLMRAAVLEGEIVDEDGALVPGAEIELVGDGLTLPGGDSVSADLFERGLEGSQLVRSGSLGVTTGAVPSIPRLGEWVMGEGDEDGRNTYVSDENGRFRMEMLTPGRYQLRACDAEHRCSLTEVVVLKSGAVLKDKRLVLRRGTWVRGLVLDDNGQPIEGAAVELDDGNLWLDERGSFDAGQRRGALVIVARAPGYEAQSLTITLPKEVRGGVAPRDISIKLAKAEARFAMIVRDENGQAIEDARVSLSWKSALEPSREIETDAKGAIRIEGMARGSVRVAVEHPDFAAGETVWLLRELGKEQELVLTLSRGGTVEVELISDVGEPIANATVSLANMVAFTDARGHAQLLHVAPGASTLTIAAQDMAPISRRVVVESEARLSLQLELTRAGGLQGTIDDERGEKVAHAVITVRDASGAEHSTTSDGEGRFEVEGLAPGDCVLAAQPPGDLEEILATLEVDCGVTAGEVGPLLELRFDRRAP